MATRLQNIHQVRMAKYRQLQEEFAGSENERNEPEHGRLHRFGAFTGISERYLSHINNGRKNIGDETARKLEKAFRKPANWMDTATAAPSDPGEAIIISLALQAWKIDPLATHKALLSVVAKA